MNKKTILNSHNLIHHFLEESANLYPDKVALIHEDVRATYGEINAQANQLARWLLDNNITQGDRVILILENCLEYVVSYYGILKAGAIAVSLGTDLKPASLQPLLQEIEPGVIISSSRFERLLQDAEVGMFNVRQLLLKNPKLNWSSVSFMTTKWEDLIQSEILPNPNLFSSDKALASIIYTSGSTGEPKGVMLSHQNIVVNTKSICQYLKLTDEDTQMVVLPFFYVMGKSLLNTHFAVAGTVVINNKFAFPASVLNQMVAEKVTGFSGVPSTYAYLLYRSPLAKYRDKLSTLRYCSQAGGHMPRIIKTKLRQILPPRTEIYIMYGATEASARLSYLEPEKFLDKMDSIGKAIPGVTLRVLDSNGKQVPAGRIGELVATGENIMQGYWKDLEATAKVLNKNCYHTGDLAYQDTEEYFYVTGREDQILKVAGHRINPLEIEDIMMDSELLIEAVVIGIPDDLLGCKLIALVIPKDQTCSQKDILRYCASKMPKYKMPSAIEFTKDIPKNTSGKIDRKLSFELLNLPVS